MGIWVIRTEALDSACSFGSAGRLAGVWRRLAMGYTEGGPSSHMRCAGASSPTPGFVYAKKDAGSVNRCL